MKIARWPWRIAACLGFLLASLPGARADVRLPAIFSDHMVLQSNTTVTVWGWADPGEEVTVAIGGQSPKTKAGADGKWMVKLEPLKTDEGLTLTVQGKNRLEVEDVLAGEVWLCSGQSNMGFSLGRAAHGAEEAATAHFPQIRFFVPGQAGALEPRDDTVGRWEVCSPSVAIHSSAVAFLFARGLLQELKVPIGIIQSSVGGTPIENWISREILDAVPGYKEIADAKMGLMKSQAEDAKKFPAERDRWEETNGVKPPENQGVAKGWADPAFDDHDWKTIALPAKWADSMGVKQGGVFWLRKEITFPKELAGRSVSLNLNYMHEQYDTTYFNGVEVGHTGDQPPYFYMGARSYEIPGKLIKEGRNVIAVRVVAANPRADLMGRGARGDYNLPLDQKSVGNQWRSQVESLLPALSSDALKSRPKVNNAALYDTPVVLFNAMIHPLIPYGIRGVVWYQGESNTGRPDDYQRLFPLLIEDWRHRWGQGDFPFYYVQIANFGDAPHDPNQKSGWATVRDAQAATLQKEPNTGMAVIIDADDGQNMHPKNKLSVGERLVRLALAGTYHRPLESSGPTYDSMNVEEHRVRLHFRHADGLTTKDGAPKWFAIAGQDRKFVWAEATIDGESIVVSSPEVGQPVAVRYCWADDPVGCNVYNAAGLPAAPFRTDDWRRPIGNALLKMGPAGEQILQGFMDQQHDRQLALQAWKTLWIHKETKSFSEVTEKENDEAFRHLPAWLRTASAAQTSPAPTEGTVAAAAAPAGRQLYVNPETGDDHLDGLASSAAAKSGPLKTIARAVKLSAPGDTIHLAQTTYHEQIGFYGVKSGEPGRPITVDGHDAVIDGCLPLEEKDWTKVGPGLYRNDVIYKTILHSKWEFVDRFSFVFDGHLVRMNHSVKAPKVTWKAPADLQIGEWTYQKEDGDAYYIKIDPNRTLADYHIALPTMVSGVQIDGNISHLVFRNITVTHVVNDGFALRTSPPGSKVRDILYQNIRTIEACDDGFSAHDDCEVRIEGFTADGCSTGIATAGKSFNDRIVTKHIHGVDLLFGQGEHVVANSRLEAHGGTAAVSVDTWSKVPGLDNCTLVLDHVEVQGPGGPPSGANRIQVRGAKGRLEIRHSDLRAMSLAASAGGALDVTDSSILGGAACQISVPAGSPWTADRNTYDIGSFQIGTTTFSVKDFANYQKNTGQDADSHVVADPK